MKYYNDITELIGNTPLIALNKHQEAYNLSTPLLAKAEFFNPAKSVKDRVAKTMIEQAEADGKLNAKSIIIEPTSGNTGIGLASIARVKGYKVILVMPDTMSLERRQLLKAYGAEIILTDGKLGMKGAIEKANELLLSIPHAFIPSQFTNPANPKAHYKTTGPEIYRDTDGTVDIFVAGVGTGGTITGVGSYLKEQNPSIKIIAVEPASSSVLLKKEAGPHAIQGIGAGFIPEILDMNIIDEIIPVTNEDAYAYAKEVAQLEGMLVGISSGAALYAATQIAKRKENKDKRIVVLFPDTGERYLSTSLYD